MILDYELKFWDNQPLTASGASKVIDLLKGGDAKGRELFLRVIVGDTVAAAGAATVALQLRTSDSLDDSGALKNPKILATTVAISKDDLVGGSEAWCIRMPYGALRYLDVNAVIATGPLTAGSFSAFLSSEL